MPYHIAMEQLSGLDASFLYLETPAQVMNVCGLILIDPSTLEGGLSFDRFAEQLRKRVEVLAPFRRRVHETPLNLGHPVWVSDPDFDVQRHVHHVGLPAPGTHAELAQLCEHIAGLPLNRDRPLWEMWYIDGLADGHVAVFAKMHHATVDGSTGANLISDLCGIEPGVLPPLPSGQDLPEDQPNDLLLLARNALSLARHPLNLVKMAPQALTILPDWIRRAQRGESMAAPFTAPRTSFNGTITGHRTVAFTRLSLDEIKEVKNAFGATVNDVVITLASGALRRYLEGRGELPDSSLVATVPSSVQDADQASGTNRVSALFYKLHTHIADPVQRLSAVAESNRTAKEHHRTIDATMLQDWAEFAAPRTFGMAVRAYSALRLAEKHPVVHNLVVSNVPGPPVPIYLLGARVEGMYPFGPVFHGAGLNMTVLSNSGHVDVGLIGCRELTPDLWSLAEDFEPALQEMRSAASPQPGNGVSAST